MFELLVVLRPGSLQAACKLSTNFLHAFRLKAFRLQAFRKPALSKALPSEGHIAKPVFSNTSWCSRPHRLGKHPRSLSKYLNGLR
jgi:hypothetical protein